MGDYHSPGRCFLLLLPLSRGPVDLVLSLWRFIFIRSVRRVLIHWNKLTPAKQGNV